MLQNLKLKNLFLLIVISELLLMVLIVYFLAVNIELKEQLIDAADNRFVLNQAADQLRQSSDDLTRFARTYVVTGKEEYKENFYRILDIRNGKAPRPAHYGTVYRDYPESLRSRIHPDGKAVSLASIMDALPYSDKEREKLRESHQNSDELVNLDIEAFNAMEGLYKDRQGKYTVREKPDQHLAIDLLYSPAYSLAKQRIMRPIDEFILMLNARTSASVSQHKKTLKKNSIIFEIIIGIFIITNIIAFLNLHQRIIKVIGYITGEIKKSKGMGTHLQPLKKASKDELGTLISEFNEMQAIIDKRTEVLEQKNERLLKQHNLIDRNIIISETDLKGNITYASEAFCKISGYSKEELLGSNHHIIHHPDMPEGFFDELWENITKGKIWQGEIKNRKKDGGFYWVETVIEPVKNNLGDITGYQSVRVDITDKKRVEKLSVTDRLTGLYNRLKIDEVFKYEIQRSERYKKAFSIVILDIDKFKSVNDTYGHLAGDQVLRDIAGILTENVRTSDIAGRWGGEEFLIICPETDITGAEKLAEKLRQLIEIHNFMTVGTRTASFGITAFTAGDREETMTRRADNALYRAKESGRNKVFAG